MNNFSAKEIQIIKSVILKAKRSFNDLYGEVYMLEDMDDELFTVLKRFKGIMVKNKKIGKYARIFNALYFVRIRRNALNEYA